MMVNHERYADFTKRPGLGATDKGRRPWGPLRATTFMGLCLVVLVAGAGADTVKIDLKKAAQFEKQGQPFKAADAYLRVLRLKPADQKARSALARVVDPAMEEKLTAAAKLEGELKLDEAIAEIEAAQRLRERLAGFGIDVDQRQDLGVRKRQLVEKRVQGVLLEAERAAADGLWSAAVAHLQQAEALSGNHGNVRERLYRAWEKWGETNLREGRLRAAAERFEGAARVTGMQSASAAPRAVAIRTGLGEWALVKGACRSAVIDLRAAERLVPGSVDPAILARAAACANTCAQLKFSADPTSGVGDRLLAILGAEVRKQVSAGASEFLHITELGSRDTTSCGRRTLPGIDGRPVKAGPYSITVRLNALTIIRQPASSVTRQALSQQGAWADTFVTYEEYLEVLSGTLSGWVDVADQKAGGQSMPLPIKVSGEAMARWQRSPVSTSTARDPHGGQRITGVVVDASGRGKAQADEARRQARESLSENLVHRFAAEASQAIHATLDVEPTVADPVELPETPVVENQGG